MTIDELVTYFIAVALSTRMGSRLSSGVDTNALFLPCSKALSSTEPETQPHLGGSEPASQELSSVPEGCSAISVFFIFLRD